MEKDDVKINLLVDSDDGPPSLDVPILIEPASNLNETTSDVGTLDNESMITSSPLPALIYEHPTEQRDSTSGPKIELYWKDLCYTVPDGSAWSNLCGPKKTRHLIKNLNGSLRNGELTAIIGPSGAGKTTLIECLSGRRQKGLTGEVAIKYNGITKSQIKISYYSQHDSLNETLTVEESLYYASILRRKKRDAKFANDKNANNTEGNESSDSSELEELNSSECDSGNESQIPQNIVSRMLEELNLNKCAKVRVNRCSGGQRRRLSIALELIFSPSIFILDEPTSGLDSLSTLQCIAMLKNLASSPDRPMLIAASIHQPTAKVMSLFDWVYIISFNGQCIYNGPSSALVETLSRFGLRCPQYHNPADFVVEIAAGELGTSYIDQLAANFAPTQFDTKGLVCITDTENNMKYVNNNRHAPEKEKTVKIWKIVEATKSHTIWEQIRATAILTGRTFKQTLRDPNIYLARVFTIIACLGLLSVLYSEDKVGRLDGCARRPNKTTWEEMQNLELFEKQHSYYGNFGFLFFSVVLSVFLAILPTLLSFPLEVGVFIKENSNGWYSLKAYYMARSIADLPPIIIFPIIYGTGSYFITEQFFDWYRFIGFNFILVSVSLLGQGVGALVSAFFVNNVTTATIVGAIINIPLFMFTGLLIRISSMPQWFQPVTYISYFRLAFESLLVIVYGMNRCEPVEPISFTYMKEEFGDQVVDMFVCISDFSPMAVDNITEFVDNYNQKFLVGVNEASSSHALKYFDYNDSYLYFNLAGIFAYVIVLRILAYVILKRKTSVK